jgi:hypothetical protein
LKDPEKKTSRTINAEKDTMKAEVRVLENNSVLL